MNFASIGWSAGGNEGDAVAHKIDQGGQTGAAANQAAADAQKRLEQNPADKAAAGQLQQAQDQRAAVDRFRDEAAAKYPDSFAVQKAAAGASVKEEDWQKGQAYADQAARVAQSGSPEWASALKLGAQSAIGLGDYPKAAAAMLEVRRLYPQDKEAAALYFMSKDRSRAGGVAPAAAQAQARPAAPTAAPSPYRDPQVEMAGERALGRQQALDLYRKAKASNDLGDAAQALGFAQGAIRADPTLPDGYMQRAAALIGLKGGDRKDQLAQAISDLRSAIELWMKNGQTGRLAEAHGLSAKLKNDEGDHKGALEDADKAVSYDAGFAAAYWQRGVAREALKQKQLALADYNKSADLAPQEYGAPRDAALARLMAPDNAGPSAAASRPGRGGMGAVLDAAGGALPLGVGAAGVLFVMFAGYIFFFAKDDSKMRRFTTWSTPSGGIEAQPTVVDGEPVAISAKYVRGRRVGSGGMGDVYEGKDNELRRRVAIKSLRAELQTRPRERERFVEEARKVASLHHPHIIEIYDIVQSDAGTFIVFEYVEGQTLHDRRNDSPGRRMEPKTVLKYLRQAAEAVDHAHKRGVVHRDLKPSNIMIDEHGRVKVMDFGIARFVMDTMRDIQTNTIVGTPPYMAPEQSVGKVTKASDVYALAVSFYEMLSGELPFRGDDLSAKVSGSFLPLTQVVSGLPPAIDAVMAKALDPDPEKRHKTCGELFEAAAAAFNEKVTPA